MNTKQNTEVRTPLLEKVCGAHKAPLLGRGWGRPLFLLLFIIGLSNANAQVGIGTIDPDASAALELKATDKGFLPPRTTPGAITNPAEGLVIYNEDINCLMVYQNPYWLNLCTGEANPPTGGDFNNGFEANTTCTNKPISLNPCENVAGASLNDDAGTADGIEYDWTDATSYMGGTNTQALVEIGGQCWFRRNTNTPTPYTGTNDLDGFYNNAASEPAVGEGRLYQWEAAMNGSNTERAQGVCPTGWHVPSDCEWMYLENTLGMSTTDQEGTGFRNSGGVGTKLKSGGSSGFTALLAGFRSSTGTFSLRGSNVDWWSSSEPFSFTAQRRDVSSSQAGVARSDSVKANGYSVRCLKD